MKTFPKIINLYNRYREKTYLEQIENNKYKINCDEFVRIGYPGGRVATGTDAGKHSNITRRLHTTIFSFHP